MAGHKKSSKAVFEERVSIVMDMLLSGLKRREIVENITKNDLLKWSVSRGQVDKYIQAATSEILKPIEKDREKLIAKAQARYDFLFKKLLNVKDYKGALAANEKSCALLGINSPAKHEVKIENKESILKSMTDEEIEMFAKIKERQKNNE